MQPWKPPSKLPRKPPAVRVPATMAVAVLTEAGEQVAAVRAFRRTCEIFAGPRKPTGAELGGLSAVIRAKSRLCWWTGKAENNTSLQKEKAMEQKTQASSKTAGLSDLSGSAANAMNRGKEALGAAASEAMDAGKAELKSLQSDMNDLKETVAKFIDRAGNETAKSAREIAGHVSATATDLAEKGANAASAATDQAKTFVTEFENMARRNPLGVFVGVLMAGVVIGMMGRRSS
jgi:ElaB/YqjD/DUF883 family membrane-anchored ribosome-binding protein